MLTDYTTAFLVASTITAIGAFTGLLVGYLLFGGLL